MALYRHSSIRHHGVFLLSVTITFTMRYFGLYGQYVNSDECKVATHVKIRNKVSRSVRKTTFRISSLLDIEFTARCGNTHRVAAFLNAPSLCFSRVFCPASCRPISVPSQMTYSTPFLEGHTSRQAGWLFRR